jgi:hypothetical protein
MCPTSRIRVPKMEVPESPGGLLRKNDVEGAGKALATFGVETAGVEVTAIMTAVNVGATYLGFRFIDRRSGGLGRSDRGPAGEGPLNASTSA